MRLSSQMLQLRKDSPLWVAGVMSGTSGDGITVAIAGLYPGESSGGAAGGAAPAIQAPGEEEATSGWEWPRIELRHHVTVPFDARLKERLFDLFEPRTARLDEVCRINMLLAEEFSKAVETCARQAGLSLSDLSLIGSHGQTICHLAPAAEQSIPEGFPSTLQIGDVSVLAERTGVTTVGNFRTRDMAVGGEGAPLVPMADWLLFRSSERTCVVQNIGGIANMTVLPKGGELDDVFACDTGPGNMLIDEAVRYITGGAEEFDRDGERAARGRVDRRLVQRWLAESYFHLPPPKSTGRELYGRERAREFFAQAEDQGVTGDDLVATITQLTIDSILLHYRRDVIPRFGLDEVIVGGGGCRNRTLMDGLSRGLGGVPVRTHEAYGIPSEAKEAIAFALLAYLTVMGRPGNLPNATGATKPVVLGVIAPGYAR